MTTPGPIDPRELAESVRSILAKIRNGELTASTATTYRLEGAVVALDILAGKSLDIDAFFEE